LRDPKRVVVQEHENRDALRRRALKRAYDTVLTEQIRRNHDRVLTGVDRLDDLRNSVVRLNQQANILDAQTQA
jgi:hypothetical protein